LTVTDKGHRQGNFFGRPDEETEAIKLFIKKAKMYHAAREKEVTEAEFEVA
jgi:hypothetical protein